MNREDALDKAEIILDAVMVAQCADGYRTYDIALLTVVELIRIAGADDES